MKGFPLSLRIFIWTYPVFFFTVKKCPSATWIYLSVSTNDPSIQSEISGAVWQVAPESKIQLVSCELSPKYLLGISALEDISAIDVYIFCDSIWYVMFYDVLSIFVNLYALVLGFSVFQWTFLSKVYGFRKFAMKLSSDPHLKHVFCFWPLRSLQFLLDLCELKGGFLYPFYFLCCLKHFSVGCEPPQWLHLDWVKFSLSLFLTEFSKSK